MHNVESTEFVHCTLYYETLFAFYIISRMWFCTHTKTLKD